MFFGTISMVQWFWIDGLQKQRQKQMQQQKNAGVLRFAQNDKLKMTS